MENNPAMESKEAMASKTTTTKTRAMDRREVTTTRAMESKEAMVGTKAMASKTTTTKTRAMGNKTTMAAVRGTTRRITTVATRAMVNRVDMVATRVMATRAMDNNKVMGRNQAMVIIKGTPRRKVDTRVGTIISTSTRILRAAPSTRRRRSPRTLPATRGQAGETSIRWEVTCPYDPLPTIHSHPFQLTSVLLTFPKLEVEGV